MPREVHTARLQQIEDLREDILKAGDEAQELKKLHRKAITYYCEMTDPCCNLQ